MISIDRYSLDREAFEELEPETLFTVIESLGDPESAEDAFGKLERLNPDLAAYLKQSDLNTRRVERIVDQIAAKQNWDPDVQRELGIAVTDWWMDVRPPCDHDHPPNDADDTRTVPQPLPEDSDDSWTSVALFFNFQSARPDGYQSTSSEDAREWLDEGDDPAAISVSEFVREYYQALSYGEHPIDGVDAPRDDDGDPLVPTIDTDGDPPGWVDRIKHVIDEVAADAWEAAGSLTKDGKRWIPSVALVDNFDTGAHAHRSYGFDRTVDDEEYLISDVTHLEFSLDWEDTTDYRDFWDTLCHEYAHNFVELGDLYGPNGAMIYWDMLGDGSQAGMMSDVTCVHKEEAPGWNYSIDHVIEGSTSGGYWSEFTLDPYATDGDAIKIIPDPEHNPYEYFIAEFRTPTGSESWRPDGGLDESGLFIVHVNERFLQLADKKITSHWGTVESPYIDAELADFEDKGMPGRSSNYELEGTLFTGEPGKDSFGPGTEPSSDFYGGRTSTFRIQDIDIADDQASFTVSLDAITHRKLWEVSSEDRGVSGHFTTENRDEPAEIFMRDDDDAALLVRDEGTWHVRQRQGGRLGAWNLGSEDREVVGDLDGDGYDEIYIRSDNWAGVVQWTHGRFETATIEDGSIEQWNLGADDRHLTADLDGDGADEILERSDEWAGVVSWDGQFDLESIQHETIGQFSLSPRDTSVVGRFRDSDRDEIAVIGDDGFALLGWDERAGKLDTVVTHRNEIGDWSLTFDDQLAVADLDGDGRDEIYVRKVSQPPVINEAAVLEWTGSEFDTAWHRSNDIKGLADPTDRLELGANDRSYAGGFFPGTDGRDGILHVANDRISFLTWDDESDAMRVRYFEKGGWFTWQGETDLIIDEFHGTGPETVKGKEYIKDHVDSAFLHNTWGTGMLAIDFAHSEFDKPNVIPGRPGITWLQPEYLMALYEPSLGITLHSEEPILDTNQAVLSAMPRGVEDADAWSIEWIDGIPANGDTIGSSEPGEEFSWSSLPSADSTLISAVATNGQQELTSYKKIEIRKSEESYGRISDPTRSGYVKEDGTIVSAQNTDKLVVGDDEHDVGSHALLTFDISTLSDRIDTDDIDQATLDLILSPPEGEPYSDLLDLNVVHVDFGNSIDPEDYRTKELKFRPGLATVEYDDGWGLRTVDVTRAVKDAVEHRSSLDDKIQFAVYHDLETDADETADYSRIQSEHANNSSHNSFLNITISEET